MKKIMLWLLAAFILQAGIYVYLDRGLFAPAASFSQQAMGGEAKSDMLVYYSHDNAFFAQVSDHGLKIFSSTVNRLVKDISLNEGESISYFSWLPESNLALVGIRSENDKGTNVTLQPINLDTNSEPVAPKISGLAKGAKIVDVAYSTKTNITNILVKNGSQASVYRTDANNDLKRVDTGATSIRRIASLVKQDALLYDYNESGKVYMIDGRGVRSQISPQGYRCALIGVDKEDNIYLARLNNSGLVSTILVGNVHSDFKELRKLDSAYPVDSIKVTYEGKISFS